MSKPEFHSPQIALCQVLIEIGPLVLEREIFKSCHYIFLLSPLKKGEQNWHPPPKVAAVCSSCHKKLAQGTVHPNFIWRRATDLQLHLRMLCAKFGWNDVGVLKKIFGYYQYILAIIPPYKEHGPSFEKNWSPFTKGCFLPRWYETGPVELENKNSSSEYFLFCLGNWVIQFFFNNHDCLAHMTSHKKHLIVYINEMYETKLIIKIWENEIYGKCDYHYISFIH